MFQKADLIINMKTNIHSISFFVMMTLNQGSGNDDSKKANDGKLLDSN